jgi:Rieske Fe-S protein
MLNRRAFIQLVAMAAGVLVWFRAPRAQAKKIAIPLDKAERLKSIGGSAILVIKDRPILFVRESASSVRALDPLCTHKKCTVAYDATTKRVVCPCHQSVFSLDGKVIKGLADKPLTIFAAELTNGRVVVTLP